MYPRYAGWFVLFWCVSWALIVLELKELGSLAGLATYGVFATIFYLSSRLEKALDRISVLEGEKYSGNCCIYAQASRRKL